MLESITWTQYLLALSAAIIIWYAVILFFPVNGKKSGFSQLAGKKEHKQVKLNAPSQSTPSAWEKDNTEPFDELEHLVETIQKSILEKAGHGISKAELLEKLSNAVINYSGLRRPAYRIALNNFIIEHAQSICGVAFSEDELDEAWDRLPR